MNPPNVNPPNVNPPNVDQTSTPPRAPESPPALRLAPLIGLIALGGLAVILATGSYRFMVVPGTKALAQGPARSDSGPHFVNEGDRIVVPEGSPLRAKLTVETVAEQEVRRTLVVPAVVEAEPSKIVKIVPPLTGRITQLKVQLGERVVAGQALTVLDSPDLGTAYADHERANVLLELARKNRDRLRDLEKIGGAANKELLQAETDYITAVVEHQRADARLQQIGVDPEAKDTTPSRMVTIKAPIAGSVIDLTTAPGAFWNDSTAVLMTLADISSVWVTANIPEKDTALISKGQPVDVVFPAYPGEVFKGEVLFISDVLDPDTRRTKVRISFQNLDMRLKPNMFANVTFFAPPRKAAAVPTSGCYAPISTR